MRSAGYVFEPHLVARFSHTNMELQLVLSAILAQLQRAGYTEDFNLSNRYLAGRCSATLFSSHEVVVDQYFCFESSPGSRDEAGVYAISLPKLNLKGTLVNAYGIYSDAASDELVQALQKNIAKYRVKPQGGAK